MSDMSLKTRRKKIGAKKKIEPEAFKLWLRKEELTVEAFCDEAGLHVHTVEKWAYKGAMPREAYAEKVKAAFPTCPLAALA